MKLHRLLFLLVPIILITLSFSCKSPSGPEPIKNPREYTWTVDTLAYSGSLQTMMFDIWASSPTDIYLVGHNSGAFGKMYHYDGKKWSDVKLRTQEGGTIVNIGTLNSIYGFAPDNIWAVGNRVFFTEKQPPELLDSSLVIHFDGQQWREIFLEGGPELRTAWGRASSDLWVGGDSKSIYHYSGSSWQIDSLPVAVAPTDKFTIRSISGNKQGQVFLIADIFRYTQGQLIYYFFSRSLDGKWLLIDSTNITAKWGYSDLWTSNSGTMYSVQGAVFRWEGTFWSKLYVTSVPLLNMFGTSDQNIFVVGTFGALVHYNGVDWFQFKQYENRDVVFSSVWATERETFVVGFVLTNPQKTIVLHGR